MEDNNNKQKKLTIIAVVTLIALVAGATYAYFSVGTTSNFGTSTINATADSIGSVVLNGNNANLNLHVTAVDMMKGENSINYYATPDGTSTDESEKETVIGTASVSPTTDTNYYHCTYTIQVSQSYSGDKNMYNIFKGTQQIDGNTYTGSDNELVLLVNGTSYDLNSNTLPKEIDGEFDIHGEQTVDITAGFLLVNLSNKNQNMLAGSGVNITIQVKQDSFTCTAIEEPPTISYYTNEGTYVTSATAHKVSDYRNLNVWKRTYNNRIYSYATESACTSAIQGNETCEESVQLYFIKETTSHGTINETTYEVCSNYGNRLVCMKGTDWENSEALKSQFTNAGLTCAYNNGSAWVGNTKPESGYLVCTDEDPTNEYSAGKFYCRVDSDGYKTCSVNSGGSCYLTSSGRAVCSG